MSQATLKLSALSRCALELFRSIVECDSIPGRPDADRVEVPIDGEVTSFFWTGAFILSECGMRQLETDLAELMRAQGIGLADCRSVRVEAA